MHLVAGDDVAGEVLVGGVAVGLLLDATETPRAERRFLALLLAVGAAMAGGGYAASFLPAIYPEVTFWGASPTFFFLRLGVLLAIVPLAWGWTQVLPGALLQEFGRSSLFVYWIHVEMVYGVLSTPLHRRIPLAWMVVAYAGLTVALLGAVRLRDVVVREWRVRRPPHQNRVEIRGG